VRRRRRGSRVRRGHRHAVQPAAGRLVQRLRQSLAHLNKRAQRSTVTRWTTTECSLAPASALARPNTWRVTTTFRPTVLIDRVLVCIVQHYLQGGEDFAYGRIARKAPEAAASQRPHAERVEAACATATVWPTTQQGEQHLKVR
jgi:hypothetical protein